jgi:phosphate-selective porin OprO/OprP
MKKTVSSITLLIMAGIMVFSGIAFGEMDIRYTDDGFKIIKNDRYILIGGSLMWDADSASDAFWDSEDGQDEGDDWQTRSELRRARLNIKTKVADSWKAKLQFDFAGNENDESVEIKDAYLEYSGWRMMNMIVGQDKEPFGLDELTSSKNLIFIERSMVTSAFAPGRNLGISLSNDNNMDTDILVWGVGVYQAETREDEGDTYAMTGRLAVVPWKSDTAFSHLGISGSYRDYDGEEFEIKESAQIHTADNIVFSDEIDTDHLILYGVETAFGVGPFSFAAEYMIADVNAVEKNDDAVFDGYYLSAGWFLTGETRPFKDGVWERVKPKSSYGAWELVTRYSYLDAADNHIGSTADTVTLGVNWYINPNVRLMNDYTHLWLTDEDTDKDTTGDAVSLRLQYVF